MTNRDKQFWYLVSLVLITIGVTVGVIIRSDIDLQMGATVHAATIVGQPINMQIARGRYLVNQVAMCADCHTPRSQNGLPIKAEWLQGTTIAFRPIFPIQNWSHIAPNIAGLPWHWNAANMVKFLVTGRDPGGHYAEPPMPAFRLNHADAVAVTTYLKNLPRGKLSPWMQHH